jgi:cohesin complex subunit SA-1/2
MALLTYRPAEVFARDQSLDDAAAWWLGRFNDNENEAMADLFNFVLKCAGCDAKLESFDVEDTDHYTEKLSEFQDEYEAQGVYEYPLISRAKGMHTFRDNFAGTFSSLIATMAKTNLLFTNEEFNEVLSSWLATMSSAASRPFRHTAVVASLTIMTALCQVGHDLSEMAGKTSRQAQGEKKRGKGKQNKGRISGLDQRVQEAAAQRETIDNMLQAWFDTVFVHRYRDVDPRIRDECVRSLGQWILLLPDKFFEGQYLRYLGWILSDSTKETRHEVVKALKTLYDDQSKLSGLRTFTERFRERMVEMATSDSDKDVRADVIKLLDSLREAGFLEPSDIDQVGRCIFEIEPKIRKAVTPFLAETINELYTAKIDDLGGEETLAEGLPNLGEDDDFEAPRLEWVKLKSLAEVLQGYDAYDAESEADDLHVQRVGPSSNFINTAEQVEPRISLVAESLYGGIPELHDWEVLSGFLLYDHSQTPSEDQNGVTEDLDLQFKQAFKLNEQDEVLLLEVLNASVKMTLTKAVEAAADKKSKKTKAQKMEAQQAQEDAASHLALLIPRLFNKFGSAPDATSSVLRLYHILNLDIFKDLARDVSEYEQLLEDIKKQFVTHANSRVLQEASQALLHARRAEELEEITDGKLQSLWEDTVAALNALAQGRDLTTRGNLADEVLTAVSNAMMKVSNLSMISDSTEYLEQKPAAPKSKKKAQQEPVPAIKSIVAIIDRGVPTDDLDADTNDREDALVLQAAQVAKFYLMWKVQTAKSFIESNGYVPHDLMINLAEFRDEFQDKLITVTRRRKGADEVRVTIAQTYLDVHLVYNALGNIRARGKAAQAARERIAAGENIDAELHTAMAMEMPRRMQNTLLQIFVALERSFAKKAKKTLEEDVDDEPVDFEEEPVDGDDDESREAEKKMLQTLLAERKLCEFAGHLGLGIWAGILDGEKQGVFDKDEEEEEPEANGEEGGDADVVRRKEKRAANGRKVGMVEERLRRNVKHLGANYRQVIDKLVSEHPAAPKRSKKVDKRKAHLAKPATTVAPAKQTVKSAEIIIEDEESEEEADPIEDADGEGEGMDVDRDAAAGAEEESVLGD